MLLWLWFCSEYNEELEQVRAPGHSVQLKI
jgi:hypothetical protein